MSAKQNVSFYFTLALAPFLFYGIYLVVAHHAGKFHAQINKPKIVITEFYEAYESVRKNIGYIELESIYLNLEEKNSELANEARVRLVQYNQDDHSTGLAVFTNPLDGDTFLILYADGVIKSKNADEF